MKHIIPLKKEDVAYKHVQPAIGMPSIGFPGLNMGFPRILSNLAWMRNLSFWFRG